MRSLLIRTLGARRQRIEAVADTASASRRLDRHHFDVVIVDKVTPGQNRVDGLDEQRLIGLLPTRS